MDNKIYDFLIVGAGLVGLSTAYHLQLACPDSKILLVEKEDTVAKHQSSHNSGVIHSGIYYKPGSLKATNCIAGYKSLIEFAELNNIPYNICGKIIVALDKGEIPRLHDIYKRGVENGLKGIAKLSGSQIKEYEPYCSGIEALYVPQTGIIDYPKLAETLLNLFLQKGGEIIFNSQVNSIVTAKDRTIVKTNSDEYHTRKLITCGGLFSDRLANYTEINNDLRIIPFRGEYYKLKKEKEYLVRNLIYPVPDPNFPFLGVHFTRMIHGGIEAGPNAVLTFKREGYRFTDFNLSDTWDTMSWPGFWKVVAKYGKTGIGEIYRSLSKTAFTKALQRLIPELCESDLESGGSGVRAQACHRDGRLIDDFNILQHNNIVHVRNAPSPAATASLAIGKYICDKIIN